MAHNISFYHIYNSLTAGNTYNISRKQTKQFEDDDAVALGNLAKDLRDKCRTLAKSDYSSGATTNIMTKLAKFIDSYNKLVDKAGDSTDYTVSRQLKNMQSLIEDNKAALKKAGINIEDDKKLKLNSEVLTKLKSESKFKTLFGGNNSFITSIQKCADKIYSKLKKQTINKDVTVTKEVALTDTKRGQALDIGALLSDFNTLSGMNYSDDNRSSISNMLNSYVNRYNTYLSTSDDNKASLMQLISINSQYKNELSNIGISINDNSTLSINTERISGTAMSDINSLFGKNAEYTENTLQALSVLFSNAAGAATEGLTINVTA